jgi:Flp pilus assembly protein TadG
MPYRHNTRTPRSGATLVETALVLGVTSSLVLGLVVVGLGVFRHQQTAAVAREAARWASVHGGLYAQETGQVAATPDSVKTQVIPRYSTGLDPNQIKVFDVTWDDASEMPTYFDAKNQVLKSNAVHVTIGYQWLPELLFGGIKLTSTSEMPMTY